MAAEQVKHLNLDSLTMILFNFLLTTTLFVNINHGFETPDDVVLQKQKVLKAEKDRLKSNRIYNYMKYMLSKYYNNLYKTTPLLTFEFFSGQFGIFTVLSFPNK